MAQRNLTHLSLPTAERTLARMRAAQLGMTVTAYVAQLVRKDAQAAGLLDLVANGPDSKEASSHGKR